MKRAPKMRTRSFKAKGMANHVAAGRASLGRVSGHQDFNTESYDHIESNRWESVNTKPLSTFSIDVDTASYANVRRLLRDGHQPPRGAVRIEEMVNYFTYDYPTPTGKRPLAVHTEVGISPWDEAHRLVKIGIKGREVPRGQRPKGNFVFLFDVSGSMASPDKLPLLIKSFKLLVGQLDAEDTVSIVVYAGASGVVLPATKGDEKRTILAALDRLRAGGSTNGGAGIELAYDIATKNFIEGGINRVILATDGDMNVGVTSRSALVDLIRKKARGDIFLTVLGFGTGNFKDSEMETLANKGNGNYAYIDSIAEGRKVLGQQVGGTLMTIAKDVKIQVEFNPAEVAGYRLVGYENRMLAARDFNDDKKDAGELGAGHTVTALYEIVPAGVAIPGASIDTLKYQTPKSNLGMGGELMTVKLRYKQPTGERSKLITHAVPRPESLAKMSPDFEFATAVAGFGRLLRKDEAESSVDLDAIVAMATRGIGEDPHGHRMAFVAMLKASKDQLSAN